MDISNLVQNYGVFAVFLGCFVEGETAAVSAGILAHVGLLVLWQTLFAVALGGFCSDIAWFFIGRAFRDHAFVERHMHHRLIEPVIRRIDANPGRVASLFRFVPGTRLLAPLALARSPITAAEYIARVAVTAVLWSCLFVLMGHTISTLVAAVLGHGHPWRKVALLVCVGVVVLLILRVRKWARHRYEI